MALYPDLPIIDPNEHPLFVATDIPEHAPKDKTRVFRYIRTLSQTTSLDLSLTELLEITNHELERFRQIGAPVAAYEWCYYPREAALEQTAARTTTFGRLASNDFITRTETQLAPFVPENMLLAAQVDVIDWMPNRRGQHVATWINRYINETSEHQTFRLGDLREFGQPNPQFVHGRNRSTEVVAEWFVDIEPVLMVTS